MIDVSQATLFLELQKYLFGLSEGQFANFAQEAWPGRWEHMCTKWFQECDQNPWEFCCRLDPTAFQEMIMHYNGLNLIY